MKRIMKHSILALLLVLGITGCGVAKVMNVPSQTINQKTTNEGTFKAIQRAGAGLGWMVKEVDSNTAIATLNLRTHQAIVSIKYSDKYYSIQYKSSVDLAYDAKENTIHKNYNGWIQNLNNAIKVQLSLL